MPKGQRTPGAEACDAFGNGCEQGTPVTQVEDGSEPARPVRIPWQVGGESFTNRGAMALVPLVEELDLHTRHVDAGRALPPATLAADAKVHDVLHVVGDQSSGPELPGERETKTIGPAACQILFIACREVTRTHHTGVRLTAGPIVVAHLDGPEEVAPIRPIESGVDGHARVLRLVAEQPPIVHARGPYDPARIEEAGRVECVLHVHEGAHERRAIHDLV